MRKKIALFFLTYCAIHLHITYIVLMKYKRLNVNILIFTATEYDSLYYLKKPHS